MSVLVVKNNIYLFFSAVLIVFTCFSAAQSVAATFGYGRASEACDADFMNTIRTRAWMEAEREIAQNQSLISRPDSVLQYTCFDQFFGPIVANKDKLFSGGFVGRDANVTPVVDLEATLNDMVSTPYQNYVLDNFAYANALGDTSATAVNYVPSTAISSGGYACRMMDQVWHAAKCADFLEGEEFLGLDAYLDGYDPRSASCEPDIRWERVADSLEEDTAAIGVRLYLNSLEGATCNPVPIPTGVLVQLSSDNSFEEAACITPGCYFDGQTCQR